MRPRIGAYVLPGDPVWLKESLGQYYGLLDDLVIPVPQGGLGWSGGPIPVDECLQIIRNVDSRGIAREVVEEWVAPEDPMRGETEQRQAALNALAETVDWVLQIDNDEFVPRPAVLMEAVELADSLGVDAVELPMRVLFRRTKRNVFEVVGREGELHHEYPGPVLVRPTVQLDRARATTGRFLRMASPSAASSLQLSRSPAENETRLLEYASDDAIVHNSWARSTTEIRRKVASWAHSGDANFTTYVWLRWWPVPFAWWALREFHPFSRGLWPRLRRVPNRGVVADVPSSSHE